MHWEKNPIKKIEKETVKIKVKWPHVNKKSLARKRIFVQKPFSHSTSKLERKNITQQNHSLFRSISSFGVTKITTPIMKMCEQICKKTWPEEFRKRLEVEIPLNAIQLLTRQNMPPLIPGFS